MKHLLWFLLAAVLFAPVSSLADSVQNFNNLSATFNIFANDGSGDNLAGTIVGRGINLTVSGGTPFEWFNSTQGFAPGSTEGGTNIFFDDVFGTIGSQTFGEGDLTIQEAFLNATGFTFPTNGQSFTVIVPASIGVIVVVNCDDSGCHTYNLNTVSGKLTLSFVYDPDTGLYYGNQGSFTSTAASTPEPATLGLVSLGIGAIALRRSKRSSTKERGL